MRDFNFFRSYQKSKSVASPKLKRYGMIAFVAVLMVATVFGFNAYTISKINKNMEEMQAFMVAPENISKYKKYLKEKEKLAVMTAYYDAVNKINYSIESKNRINTETIDTLLSTMPSELMLQTMEIQAEGMAFQGLSKSHSAIAEFEHNMKETGLFKHVLVSNISKVNDSLTPSSEESFLFTMTCQLKGGQE